MRTIQLKIHDDVYDKLMWLLSKFDSKEVEIVKEADHILGSQAEDDVKNAQNQYNEIERNLELALKKYKSNK